MTLSEEGILERMRKPVGKPVIFTYPEGQIQGILKARSILASNPSGPGVPYWDVVDLIEFKDEPEQQWLRIGYYRKPKDTLVWGSQTTITEPIGTWKKLLVHAASEQPWFRQLLEEVVSELNMKTAQPAQAADR
jgi:hypothetical protein